MQKLSKSESKKLTCMNQPGTASYKTACTGSTEDIIFRNELWSDKHSSSAVDERTGARWNGYKRNITPHSIQLLNVCDQPGGTNDKEWCAAKFDGLLSNVKSLQDNYLQAVMLTIPLVIHSKLFILRCVQSGIVSNEQVMDPKKNLLYTP